MLESEKCEKCETHKTDIIFEYVSSTLGDRQLPKKERENAYTTSSIQAIMQCRSPSKVSTHSYSRYISNILTSDSINADANVLL